MLNHPYTLVLEETEDMYSSISFLIDKMGVARKNWFSVLRKKLKFHGSSKTITIQATCEDDASSLPPPLPPQSEKKERVWSGEDVAAIRIQAMFRGHLARQAFRALRSVVKLQALVRGVRVRTQSRIALHCMHAMVRLQVRVRARQLLGDGVLQH